MDLDEALAALPLAYATAIRLASDGARLDAIADALGVDPAAVPALLEIGHRKLASLLEEG